MAIVGNGTKVKIPSEIKQPLFCTIKISNFTKYFSYLHMYIEFIFFDVFRLWIKDSMGMFGWAPRFWPTIYFWCWQLICSNLTIQGDIATMNIHFCTKISKPVNNTLTNVSLICSIILILVSDNVCLISNWNKIGMFKVRSLK